MYSSIRNSTANKNAPPREPTIPSAFPKKKNNFAPPPKRTTSASASTYQHQQEEEEEQGHGYGGAEEGEEEGQAEGEWAEALYDYTSEEASDLQLRARQRVLVTEKTSDDWCVHIPVQIVYSALIYTLFRRWTGEINGKTGLFPASYVKLL